MRISSHPCADAFQEAVVPKLAASNGLILGIPRRFRDAGQQGLDERIDECEQSLLSEPDATNLAGQTVKARGESNFRRIDPALWLEYGIEDFERESAAIRSIPERILEVLPQLYSEVLVPTTVADELRSDDAPETVRRWMPAGCS